MSLSRKSAVAVETRPADAPLPAVLDIEDGPFSLSLDLTAAAPIGVAFESLRFAKRTDEPPLTSDALRRWCSHITERLTYLMEPIVLHELDDERGQADLRSRAPSNREGRRVYYLMRAARDRSLTLSRVAFDEATRNRLTLPCQLTIEVLERLVEDLEASVP